MSTTVRETQNKQRVPSVTPSRRISDAQIPTTWHRKLESEDIRAVAAGYDVQRDRIWVELSNGGCFAVPRLQLEGLKDATPEQLSKVIILGPGTAIAWDAPDVGFTLEGLLEGIYGSQKWMATLGRKGGSARTTKKARAARINGAKGGRPKRTSG